MDTWLTFRDLHYLPDMSDKTLTFNPFISDIDLELVRAADAAERNFVQKKGDADLLLMQALNETTPLSQKIRVSEANSDEVSAKKRKLFHEETPKPGTSSLPFSLPNIYSRLFGCEPKVSHRAEDDVMTLLKCCLRCGPKALEHFDKNSRLFSTVQNL